MSEIKRFQPNSIWDDSWVVEEPPTELIIIESPSEQPKTEVKPEDWS